MRDLTDSQQRVMAFIQRHLARHGFPPTHAEIAAGLGFRSQNAATEHVRLLVKKGALAVVPGAARSLRVIAPRVATQDVRLPVVGEVAAGQPILAVGNVERLLEVDPSLFQPRADFLLRVRGDSMIEADIRPGDLLAIHRTPVVADGAIAVVRLDDDVTVKRFRTRAKAGGGRGRGARAGRHEIVLEPANRALAPIVVDPLRVTVAIEGLVVGLLRTRVDGTRVDRTLATRRLRP